MEGLQHLGTYECSGDLEALSFGVGFGGLEFRVCCCILLLNSGGSFSMKVGVPLGILESGVLVVWGLDILEVRLLGGMLPSTGAEGTWQGSSKDSTEICGRNSPVK